MKAEILNEEVFKDIPDYEGLYQISNKGRIKCCRNNKIKKTVIGKIGYERATLVKNKKVKAFTVHRLVIMTWIGKNDLEVNHKDGNKLNNCIDNLEYCTRKENMHHAIKNGMIKWNHLYREIYKICPQNKTIIQKYDSIKHAAIELNATHKAIWQALKHGNKCKGYEWQYA